MILLTPEQAAEFLSLSVGTLADWRWQRKGPKFKRLSRGCVRYSKEDLEDWVQAQTVAEIPKAS